MARVNAEVRAFMLRSGADPDRKLRMLLVIAHAVVQIDTIKQAIQPRLIADRELDLMIYREAGIDVIGR